MISRALLLTAAIGWGGANLLPQKPAPLTSQDIREVGRKKSISNVCDKKKKSKKVKELCKKWEQ
jgi:hypothetical protein